MEILYQLGVDRSYFFQFLIIAAVVLFLGQVYFKPFLKLFQERQKRTIEDREAAERLIDESNKRLAEYQRQMEAARQETMKIYEGAVHTARQEEVRILSHARAEAKKITQEAIENAEKQGEKLRQELAKDVDALAKTVSERMLAP